MLDPADVADSIFGFRVQQAVEKCLKGWLALLAGEFPFTHDLALLLDLVQEHADVSRCQELIQYTLYAVQLRYDISCEDVPIDRRSALEHSEDLWNVVRDSIAGH